MPVAPQLVAALLQVVIAPLQTEAAASQGSGWNPLEGGRSAPGGGCSSLERCPGGSTRTAGDAVEGE